MMFFYFLFILILLLDAFSFERIKMIEYLLVLQAPIFLFVIDYFQKKSIKIPKVFFMLQTIFLSLFVISNVVSDNFSNLNYQIGLYTALILISIYCYNYKDELRQKIRKYIIWLSVLFTIINIFRKQIITLFPFIGINNSHIISYTSLTHNHLGDFLVLSLIIFISELLISKQTKNKLLIFFFIFFTFIFSYSRSAYLSLITTLISITYPVIKKINNYKKIIIGVCLLISIFFLFFSPLFTKIFFNNVAKKTPLGNREIYYKQAIEGFIKKPYFGWGFENYYKLKAGTVYSHNIFLDMLSENGIFVFLAFLSLIMYGLFYGEKNLYYFLLIALLVNFQTDFTYKIIPFQWLFFIFFGLIIK